MPEPKKETDQQAPEVHAVNIPKVFSDEWRKMQNGKAITNQEMLDMWAAEMIEELDLGKEYKLPDGPIDDFRTKFEKNRLSIFISFGLAGGK